MKAVFPVALCCNGALLPGLHATLASLVHHLGEREKIALHLFVSDIDAASRADLAATVNEAGGVGALTFHEADTREFEKLETLHGELIPYLRLKLPDLLPEADRILYLDADLIVHTDVGAMPSLLPDDAPLGAVPGERVAWNLDHDIFQKVGFSDEDTCFNSGVLLINATWWRQHGVLAQVLDFARKNPGLLRSHDQTILNIFFMRSFCRLPIKFNRIVSPEDAPIEPEDGVYHFMGSPKPWDPLGSRMHSNFRLWKREVAPTRFRWRRFLARYWRSRLERAWSLRNSYARVTLRKMKSLLRRLNAAPA